MSDDHSRLPQRKPTGASDHILAGARYGLESRNVTDEPSSFAAERLEKLTISPQSSMSAGGSSYSSRDGPPPLPPKVPVEGSTTRSGSLGMAPPKHRVLAPVDRRPPSPPRQRRVPPPLYNSGSLTSSSPVTSRASSPLTPPLTPRLSEGSPTSQHRMSSAQPTGPVSSQGGTPAPARPLPHLPPSHTARPPQYAPTTSAEEPPQAVRGPQAPGLGSTPQVTPCTVPAARPPIPQAKAPLAPVSQRPPGYAPTAIASSRAATLDEQPSAAPDRTSAPHQAPPPQPIRAATLADEARSPPKVHPSAVKQASKLDSPTIASRVSQTLTVGPESRNPTRLPDHQLASSPTPPVGRPAPAVSSASTGHGPSVPPKTPSGSPVPEKQQSIVSAPGKIVASPQSTLNSTTSPPKPTTPTASASVPVPRKDRPKAEPKGKQKVDGKTPIKAVCYLDPCLKNSLLTVPASLTTTADATLSAVEAYPEQDFNWTIGAPIGGIGGLAKHYILRPDAKFESENGGISLTLAVVDERGGGVPTPPPADGSSPPPPKGRTKARVEVRSDKGGILVDLKELDANRQIDMLVETRKGDVLVLLPENFLGPLHVRAEEEPSFGSILQPQLDEVVNPYEDLWTTNVVPLGAERGAKRNKFRAHKLMKGVSKWVPSALREQDDYLDMAVSSYTTLKKGGQSKILVKNPNGKVCFGLRGSKDEKDLREDIKVGAEDGTKKHWWS